MIAEFKFAATYLAQSTYPALLAALSLFASLIMPPPGSEWPFAANVLMWLGILTMIGSLALIVRQLTRRQPSLNEILSGLMTVKTFDGYKEEQRLRCVGLEKQISDARHSFDERSNTDLVRIEQTFGRIFKLGEQRDRDMGKFRDTISRLQERTETHIRKIDQFDGKLDNLLSKVSEAVARGERQAQQQQE
jgi:hypothetical protein